MIDLSESDHNLLDEYLNAVLNAYRDGFLDLATARGDLAHLIAAAAKDNAQEVAPYAKMRVEELSQT